MIVPDSVDMQHFSSLPLLLIFYSVDVGSKIVRRKRFIFFFINITLVPKNNPYLTFPNLVPSKPVIRTRTSNVPVTVPPVATQPVTSSSAPQPTTPPATFVDSSPNIPVGTTPAEAQPTTTGQPSSEPPPETPQGSTMAPPETTTVLNPEMSNAPEETTMPGSGMSTNTSAQAVSRLHGWETEWSDDGMEITFVSPNVKITSQSQPSRSRPKSFSSPSQFTPCLRTGRTGKLVKALCFKISV